MDGGRVLEKGSHEELINKEGGMYRSMWEMQVASAVGGTSSIGSNSANVSMATSGGNSPVVSSNQHH
jgi:hypothetical protein